MKRFAALKAVSFTAVAAAGAWVLYTYAPAEHAFYPRCVFKALTGLDCPGCGSTRALHQLLHGNVEAAFRLNPMLFVLIALVLIAMPSILRGRTPHFIQQPWFGWSALVVMLSYWVFRNTPLYPF